MLSENIHLLMEIKVDMLEAFMAENVGWNQAEMKLEATESERSGTPPEPHLVTDSSPRQPSLPP